MMEQRSLLRCGLLMVVLTLALFFLPLLNGLLAGLLGGYKAGNWKRGLVAALLPAVLIPAGLWLAVGAIAAYVDGLIVGGSIAAVVVLAEIGLLVGATVGGWCAELSMKARAYF